MRFESKTVTPDVARVMLTRNKNNRILKVKRVQRYSDDMKTGNWTLSTDPICFDKDGNLLNGQHRLNAVIQADVPVLMTVAYDVPNDAVIDKGLERNTGDALYMRGKISLRASRRDFVAVAKRYLEIMHIRTPSDSRVADFLNANEKDIEVAISISSVGKHNPLCKRAPVQTAILAAIKHGISQDTLLKFSQIVNTGFMEQENQTAAIVLRNYIIEKNLRGATQSNDMCAFAQLAIRDFSDGIPRKQVYKKLGHIYIRSGEK